MHGSTYAAGADTRCILPQTRRGCLCARERSCLHIKVHTIWVHVGKHAIGVGPRSRHLSASDASVPCWPYRSPSHCFLLFSGNLLTDAMYTFLHMYAIIQQCVFVCVSGSLFFSPYSLMLCEFATQTSGRSNTHGFCLPLPSALSQRETGLCQMSC